MKKILKFPAWFLFVYFFLDKIFPYLPFEDLLYILWFGGSFVWFFVLGKELFKKLPGGHSIKIKSYYFYLFACIICFIGIYFIADGQGFYIDVSHMERWSREEAILFVLMVFVFTGILKCYYTLSKSLAVLDNYSKHGYIDTRFGEYIGYFLEFLFFPIGIWWLQPKIKKIVFNEIRQQTTEIKTGE